MTNNSDEVKRREQLEYVLGILAEVRSEVKRLEHEVLDCTPMRGQIGLGGSDGVGRYFAE
jgi:hypothetical protein